MMGRTSNTWNECLGSWQPEVVAYLRSGNIPSSGPIGVGSLTTIADGDLSQPIIYEITIKLPSTKKITNLHTIHYNNQTWSDTRKTTFPPEARSLEMLPDSEDLEMTTMERLELDPNLKLHAGILDTVIQRDVLARK